jgi:hypothetical protein
MSTATNVHFFHSLPDIVANTKIVTTNPSALKMMSAINPDSIQSHLVLKHQIAEEAPLATDRLYLGLDDRIGVVHENANSAPGDIRIAGDLPSFLTIVGAQFRNVSESMRD